MGGVKLIVVSNFAFHLAGPDFRAGTVGNGKVGTGLFTVWKIKRMR